MNSAMVGIDAAQTGSSPDSENGSTDLRPLADEILLLVAGGDSVVCW
jgi:hypothetical protein